jgi:hypothetical protein
MGVAVRMAVLEALAFGRCVASASSTAIRTATPISTCSLISDCAPSATRTLPPLRGRVASGASAAGRGPAERGGATLIHVALPEKSRPW